MEHLKNWIDLGPWYNKINEKLSKRVRGSLAEDIILCRYRKEWKRRGY